ncbi:hypothetical protein GDO86_018491 [Hymenochirus boettgeri]|uniref:KRAB domain-containing protein n=1 Tax=Hymenochirus boettgeri TaxID=247094 RepID=A0A8T2IEB3_9PIPI|nr:hypothetical protein GDO86_018491 [Hymenochirus boettgeri]
MEKAKSNLDERILSITLQIIHLLTGEPGDGVPQSCTDCMLEGSCRLHPPTVSHPSRSVIQKENDKKILDLISNIIHLLTGEVAIRCEDVSIYLTLEEWEYLKGNETLYREVMEENPQIHFALGK